MSKLGQYLLATIPALVALAFFTSFANWIPQARWEPPKKKEIAASTTPAELAKIGESLVRERGCMACHTMEPGVGVAGGGRGPNFFDVAARRAKGVTGGPGSLAEYLVQALYDPAAYIVEGYAPLMPPAISPPAKLNYEEVVAVVNYLQSLGGTPSVKVGDIARPPREGERAVTPPQPAGGAQRSKDPAGIMEQYGCTACHALGGRGGNIGPSLDNIGATAAKRIPGVSADSYLRQSILDPNAYVVESFNPGIMPQDLGDRMTGGELEVLVKYLLSLGR